MSDKLALRKSSMSTQQLLVLESEMAHRRRSPWIAYLTFFMLSGIGGHHWYLKNHLRASSYIMFGVLMLATIPSGPRGGSDRAFMLFMFLYLGQMGIDFLTLAYQVGRANRKIEDEIIGTLTSNEAEAANRADNEPDKMGRN